MPGLCMDRDVGMPALRQVQRAPHVDQRVARAREHQHRHPGRNRRGTETRGGQQLAQGVRLKNGPEPAQLDPVVEHVGRGGGVATRQSQHLLFATRIAVRQQREPQQRAVVRRQQPSMPRVERPQAGVDQHAAGDRLRIGARPVDRDHRAHRHREQPIWRREAQAAHLRTAPVRHRLDAGGAVELGVQAVARQIERDHARTVEFLLQQRAEPAPMTALARQPAQQDPGAHRRPLRYQRASASSR